MAEPFPFFRAAIRDGRVVIAGAPEWRGGHRIGEADGLFGEWKWDGTRLVVRNDRYGFHPVFFHAGRDEIVVSNSILRLIAEGVPGDPDAGAIGAFLRLGFFIGDDTPYRAIRALPPGAALCWEAGRWTLDSGMPDAAPSEIGRDDALDGYIALFRAAVARRSEGVCAAMPLSGGRDSRHILLELVAGGRPPGETCTVEMGPSYPASEAAIARALSQRLGIPHSAIAPPRDLTQAELRKNAVTNFCGDEGAWMMTLDRHLLARTRVIYDGIAGDVLSAGLFVTPERIALTERGDGAGLVRDFIAACKVWSEDALDQAAGLLGDAPALSREAAEARIGDALRPHAERHNPTTSFYFWNRTRREIAGCALGIMTGQEIVYAPYLDHALFDFLYALPERMLADKRFHTDAIARAWPEHADIGYVAAPPRGESRLERLVSRGRAAAGLLSWIGARRPGLLGRTAGWTARSVAMGPDGSLNRCLFTLVLQSLVCADRAEAARQLADATRRVTPPAPR